MPDNADAPKLPTDWHRLFGLLLMDFFAGTPFGVEIEKDLSFQEQFLDVAVMRRRPEALLKPLPDGMDDLGVYNLLTFKSHRGILDAWAIKELIAHYVNYRKQNKSASGELLPESDFRLFGICVRFPKKLNEAMPLVELSSGVYDLVWGVDRFRIIVIRLLPDTDANAMLGLFSAREAKVAEARRRFRLQSPQTSSLVQQILGNYEVEGKIMPYTMEEFEREFKREFIAKLTPEERLRGLPAEDRLRGLPAEERLRGLPVEERLRGLPAEARINDLSDEELQRLEEQIATRRKASAQSLTSNS